MGRSNMDINRIDSIIKKIIENIGSSRNEIFQIADNLRNEHERIKAELIQAKDSAARVIEEVEELGKQDKKMRQKLAEVSADFNTNSESKIKQAYESAEEVRIKYILKKNEESALREKRNTLEIALKKSLQNIESAEKITNQVGIALGYLEGDALSDLEGYDKNNEMVIGIKILEAQENERKRIARDIHDGPAQHMANVVMRMDICRMVIQKDLQEGLNEMEELKASVKTALKEVRGIIFNLRPMSLDDLGLVQTIKEMVKSISGETGIGIDTRLKPVETEIEPIIQVAVYRIIQELFNNIKKHAMAKHAEIKLDFGTKYLMLAVCDDGIGFNVDETLLKVKTKGISYGLIGIMDRVNQLQGEIDIRSAEGEGTTYCIKLPINREVVKDEKWSN